MAVWSYANGLDCRACNKQLQDFRGCVKDAARQYEIEGTILNRCPLRVLDERSVIMLEFYMAYKKGFLPNAGGWLDQTVRFSRSVAVIEDYSGKLQEEKNHGN